MGRTLVGYLRLVRFPLIFTAIADSWGYYVLSRPPGDGVSPWTLGELAICSAALLCFGMAFNDLLDFGKDVALHPDRPLPAGQVSTAEAAIVVALALLAAGVASYLNRPWMMLAAGIVAILIALYDGLLKRWPFVGLVVLGLIRFHHAALIEGGWPATFLWQPLWLLNHVVLLSVVGHRLEDKQPLLGRVGAAVLAGVWVLCNAAIVLVAGYQQHGAIALPSVPWAQLFWPAVAFLVFVMLGTAILFSGRVRTDSARAGWLMRIGLPWLIVYDAAFVASTDRWPWAIAIGGLAAAFAGASWAIAALQSRAESRE